MTYKFRSLTLFAALLVAFFASAEGWKWFNPMDAGFPVVQNQGWTSELGKTYYRLPDRARDNVRGPVWNLSRHSAGLSINFYSNAPEIKVRYTVEGPVAMHHMPATGVSGVDLYGIDQDGKSRHFVGYFNNSNDTVWTRFVNNRMNEFHNKGYEFRLYLPLYNGVKNLEIGIPDGSDLSFIPVSDERPIVVYGTSIEHGACASRPAMAWTTQVQRSFDLPLINLGFSGNGRLEQPLLDLMTEHPERLYVLACMTNLTRSTPEQDDFLITNAVATLRAKNDAPIILMDHPGFSDTAVNESQNEIIERLNTAVQATYDKLIAAGHKNLYHVSAADINLPYEGWVDNVHPSDYGMTAIAAAIEKTAREALNMPAGNVSTTRPVTQRREAASYEWRQRHRDVMARNAANPPRRVIIGNSITHFWGGDPVGHVVNGQKIWDKYLAPLGYGNLGFGWDRIENGLWRVYHGELDGYDAEEVVIMLGTNNYGLNSPEEITEGLQALIRAVRDRQPSAKIKMVGILPRRGGLDWVNTVNTLIADMAAAEDGVVFINPGVKLLDKNGALDESLFTDGLHPNEQGYARIVADIIAE